MFCEASIRQKVSLTLYKRIKKLNQNQNKNKNNKKKKKNLTHDLLFVNKN